ncbi:hypothetical protein FG386_001780 [Cryptosporidium ryanae]|uniref:uncharacterized protein n=1 Tax=Cryptosporidium ryanae TaxID=515981 RepID=UPI003519E6B2|nr:hypothetical protein FG386_001780 [Cryptosporidium ryanae]
MTDGKREFLDLKSDLTVGGRIENLIKISGNEEERTSDGRINNEIPPWKVKPIDYNDSIIKKAKNFLSVCNTVGDEPVITNKNLHKKVVMDVHLGVFDVNGEIPKDDILRKKNIVDVPVSDFSGEAGHTFGGAYDCDHNFSLESEDSDENGYTRTRAKEIIERAMDKKSLVQVIYSSDNCDHK